MLLAECVVYMKLIFSHVHLLNMQVRRDTWQGIPAVYKVWDLGDSLEPLQDRQHDLDAYHALCPLRASVSASVSLRGQCRCRLPSLSTSHCSFTGRQRNVLSACQAAT